jgi:hypothetical protein
MMVGTHGKCAPGHYIVETKKADFNNLQRPDIAGLKFVQIKVPNSFQEAVTSPLSGYWHDAMKTELEQICKFDTREVADLRSGRKPIKSKWVFDVNPYFTAWVQFVNSRHAL